MSQSLGILLDQAINIALLMRLIIRRQANGFVDFELTLLVCGGQTDGSEDFIHLFQGKPFRLGDLDDERLAQRQGSSK